MEESNGKIRDVLNDDQKKQFDAMHQRRGGRMGGHGNMQGQGHMGGGGANPQ